MRRTNIIQLLPSKRQKVILKEMMLLSSCVYNQANYIIRNQFINNEKISTSYDLKTQLQSTDNYQLLGRSYAGPKIQKYYEMIIGYFSTVKSKTQKYVGLPSYYKNRKTNTTIPSYLIFDSEQYNIKKNYVRIPLSHQMKKKYNIKHFYIEYNGILRYKGKQQRGEIHFRNNNFYLHQCIELPTPNLKTVVNSIGIDLGIKRLITSIDQYNNVLMIGSNRFYKQWNYYNQLIDKEQSFLKTINRKSSSNLKLLFSKRKKYQKQLFDNAVCKLFRFIKKNNVQQIFNYNRMINNYWSYDILTTKILCKAEEQGITVNKTKEYYTSTTCPNCNYCSKNNVSDRTFNCTSCGYSGDRDIVGAKNILFKGMYGLYNGSVHQGEVALLEGII